MARAFSWLAAAALLALAVPGLALPSSGVVVLDDVRPATDTYVAWRLTAPADSFTQFEVEADGPDADLAAVGLYIQRVVGGVPQFDSGYAFATAWDGATYAHVGTVDPAGAVVSARPLAGRGAPVGVTVGNFPSLDVEWVAVAMVGSDAGLDARITLSADPTVRLLGRTTGPAFLLREPDFQGPVNVAAQVGKPGLPGDRGASVMVKAIEGASRSVDVQGRLFGVFYGLSNTNDLQLSVDGPGGHRDLPCVPNAQACEVHQLFVDEPSGTHTFRIDHSTDFYADPLCRVEACWHAPIYAFAADVVVP